MCCVAATWPTTSSLSLPPRRCHRCRRCIRCEFHQRLTVVAGIIRNLYAQTTWLLKSVKAWRHSAETFPRGSSVAEPLGYFLRKESELRSSARRCSQHSWHHSTGSGLVKLAKFHCKIFNVKDCNGRQSFCLSSVIWGHNVTKFIWDHLGSIPFQTTKEFLKSNSVKLWESPPFFDVGYNK